MSIFAERLTTCAHDAAVVREHRNRVAGRFRIALASAKSKQLLETAALRSSAEACTLASESTKRLLAAPLFEWATSLLSSAVATDASLTGEFVVALQGAMRHARHARGCTVPIDRVELLAFEAPVVFFGTADVEGAAEAALDADGIGLVGKLRCAFL